MTLRTPLAIALILLACSCTTSRHSSSPRRVRSTATTTTSSLYDTDVTFKRLNHAAPYSLGQLKGKVVVIDVWATWCEPCRDAMPLFHAFAQQHASDGLEVLTLNVDEDASHVAKFAAENQVSLPILLDPGAAFAEQALKVRVIPSTVVIGRNGTVAVLREGFAEELEQAFGADVTRLLHEGTSTASPP